MGLPVTYGTTIAALKTIKEPNIVVCIEGYDKCIGSGVIREIIRIGEPDLLIDGSWLIGGTRVLEDQLTLISLDGSSKSIRQQLEVDKAKGSSIQALKFECVDVNGAMSRLISPGVEVDDVLGNKAKVYLAIDNASAVWPHDYVLLFRGYIDDITSMPASVILNITHPDQRKRQAIWPQAEGQLTASIDTIATTIDVDDASQFLLPVLGPDGVLDTTFKTYAIIDQEAIEYTGISGNQLTGCVRAQLGTPTTNHDNEAEIKSLYRITGDAMSMALKFMLSREDYYQDDLGPFSFNVIPNEDSIPNAVYFQEIDIFREYGVTVGDYATCAGSTGSLNDFSMQQIVEVGTLNDGSYMVIDGVSLVDESDTPAVVSLRSKYDSWPLSLGMGADEVDVKEHETIRQTWLSGFEYDLYVKESIEDGREFMENELYKPASAYSVPRKTQSSVRVMVPPLPGADTKLIDETNILRPDRLQMRRSTARHFANTIAYRYDEDPIEEKFLKGYIAQSATSLAQVKVGTKALVIESKGLRTSSLGQTHAQLASSRRLKRYEFGAEYFAKIETTFGAGFDLEVADIVIFDPSKLSVVDTTTGGKERPAGLYEIQNKTLNYKTGQVVIDLINTKFDTSGKYALVGPSSKIKTGIDNKTFVVEQFYRTDYGAAEWQKWARYKQPGVVIRSEDGTTRYKQTVLVNALSNTFVVRDDLGFVPQPGDIIEISKHDFVDTTDEIKLRYGHMAPLDGGATDPYQMI